MGMDMEVSVLFLCLMAIGSLFVHAKEAPPGFISIACGAPKDEPYLGLDYKSDEDLIDSGIPKQISPQFRLRGFPSVRSLRSFPNGTRNCYRLQPQAGAAAITKYLIRAFFLSSDSDGLNSLPIFDFYIGTNFFRTVVPGGVIVEAIALSTIAADYIEVCLVRTNNGAPYINALELRPLDVALYPIDPTDSAKFLAYREGLDVGGNQLIRYPEDVYDRLWEGFGCLGLGYNVSSIFVSTDAAIIKSTDDGPYKLPKSMLQTACRASNSTSPLEIHRIHPDVVMNSRFYFCFHFAEIEKLEAGQFREMRIVFNDVYTITKSIRLQYLKPHTICSKGYNVTPSQGIKLSIYATSPSGFPPILNGFEFLYTVETPNPLTFSQDVIAIRNIKQHYKLIRNWEGDPCEPRAFSWEGLNCSNSHPSPRIISLNLSSSNLTGDIASSISALNALEFLDLSYNELEGAVPESLAQLPQLKLLNLSGNNLTGVIPDSLLQKNKNGTLILRMEGNPQHCWSRPCNHKKLLPIPILCSVIAAPILVILLGVIVLYTRKSKENLIESEHGGSLKLKSRQYSYLEVVSITDNFRVVIGEGGFGKVYLGVLKDQTKVAVKVLSSSSQQGYKEFQAEAQLLMVLHHRNLVSLLGYCDEGDHKTLIYEYMPNGNLWQHLLDTNTNPLNWMERLQIAVDVAQGLEYLHNGCKPSIIHRDLKPANILLDRKMQAKIADFGLSRTLGTENKSQPFTRLAGTVGYIDPGAQTCGNVNKKSDVYSFGIILLELITGHPAITRSSQGNFHILNWVEPMIRTGDIQQIVDAKLGERFNQNSAKRIVELAISCTQPNALERPDMSHVLEELKDCLAVHQNTSIQTSVMSSVIVSESDMAPSPR